MSKRYLIDMEVYKVYYIFLNNNKLKKRLSKYLFSMTTMLHMSASWGGGIPPPQYFQNIQGQHGKILVQIFNTRVF